MRLIDADALTIKLDAELMDISDYLNIHEQIKDIIDNAPTIPLPDFKEGYKQAIIDGKTNYSIPQGKWIDTGEMEEYWAEEYRCSICGEANHHHNFCPNCGADMRGS